MNRGKKMAILDWSQCQAVESVPTDVVARGSFGTRGCPWLTVFENLEPFEHREIIEQFHVTPRADSGSSRICRPQPRRAAASRWRVCLG